MRLAPRQGRRLILVFLLTAAVLPEPAAKPGGPAPLTSPPEPVNLQAITQQHGRELAQLRSDTDALSLYRNGLGQALELHDTLPLLREPRVRTRRTRSIPPPDLRQPAIHLAGELAAWHMAARLRKEAEGVSGDGLRELLETTNPQQQWLSNRPGRETLNRAIALARVTSSFRIEDAREDGVAAAYRRLANHLDQAYPELTRGKASWLAVAEEEGMAGIRRRLMETGEHDAPPSAQAAQAAVLYFDHRLRPVLIAQVIAFAIRAEAEAERGAHRRWLTLRSWREEWNTKKGRARLCGTWSWTVHNHQNHQDHKMLVTFPPPDSPAGPGPQPSKIVILGDGVYLRWEFQDGYQEDSLLFTGKGERLEGTFVNTRGPYGAITGKRAAPCKRQE